MKSSAIRDTRSQHSVKEFVPYLDFQERLLCVESTQPITAQSWDSIPQASPKVHGYQLSAARC